MTEKTLAAVATDVMTTELREFDIPEIGADDGLLELEAAGICGSDWRNYQFNSTPRIMGHENVGRVAKIGAIAAKRWKLKEGDRISLEEYVPCGQCTLCRSGDFRLCQETEVFGVEKKRPSLRLLAADRGANPMGRLQPFHVSASERGDPQGGRGHAGPSSCHVDPDEQRRAMDHV